MTASSLSVTPGSGLRLATNSYTEGAVTVHDEKVILGEQYLPSYNVITSSVSTATLDSHLLQIMAGASLRVRIRRIDIFQTAMATTAAIMQLAIFRLTTAGTGGTSITPEKFDPADAASGATAMTLPTAKGTNGGAPWGGNIYLMQTLTASDQLVQPSLTIDFDRLRTGPLIIAAGTSNGIAIQNQTAHAAATVRIDVLFSESSF